MQKLNIILPAHNEHGNIQTIYNEIVFALSGNKYDYEILFIDDGSTDDTLAQIKELAISNPKVKFIALSRNFGHQNALKAGIDATNADVVIMMDCDLQHPPHLINELLRNYELGYEIVRTNRIEHEDTGYIKTKTSSLFYNVVNKFSDISIEEGSADFRLISGAAINYLKSFNEFDLFYRGLVKWMGFNQISIEYKAQKRYSGLTKYSYNKMISFGLKGFTSFSTKPLYFAAYLGMFFAMMSLLYIPYIFYAFFNGTEVHGWASVIATVAFFGGVNLMILGIIGFYISKLVIQTKNRPHYIIKASNL